MKKILLLMKKYLIVIVAVIVAALACGFAVAYIRKPYYTASEPVDYSAVIGSSVTSSNSAMMAYMDTIVDFCDTGVVVDRANYYYYLYVNGNVGDMNEFIAGIRAEDDYEEKLAAGLTDSVPEYITRDMIDTDYGGGAESYTFVISLKDYDAQTARQKLRILILAFDLEITDYFPGVTTRIRELVDDENDIPARIDISNTKILIIAFIAGCLLAVVAVYLLYILDNTISEKEEFESITRANLLAYIDDQEAV